MIPFSLQQSLKKRILRLFKEKQYKTPRKTAESTCKAEMSVYTQDLPIPEEKNQQFAPFVLTKIHSGGQKSFKSSHSTNVSIVVSIYETDKTAGFETLANCINSIISEIKKRPVFDNTFELDFDSPIDWEVSEEDTYPYFFGGISLNFKTIYLDFENRVDVEGLI